MSEHESDKDRILRMVAEGVLRPNEAAQLLKAVAEEPAPRATEKREEAKKPEPKPEAREDKSEKPGTTQVQIQRPDGTLHTIEVPMSLVPMVMKMAGVYIQESVRTAAIDTWDGLKVMARNKTTEVRDTVLAKVDDLRGKGKEKPGDAATKPAAPTAPAEDTRMEARKRILQMVQNGRLSTDDATRLLAELDALEAYQKG